MPRLTDEQRTELARLRRENPEMSWCALARAVGTTYSTARYALDPAHRAVRQNYWSANFGGERRPAREKKAKKADQLVRDPLYDPKRDGKPAYESPYAEMFGDPPLGRRQVVQGFLDRARLAHGNRRDDRASHPSEQRRADA